MASFSKRLIEVDLPIRRISQESQKDKSIRHGHISTLHIWWARRPLAACRAVACAALWPDPADKLCPATFVSEVKAEVRRWSQNNIGLATAETATQLLRIRNNPNLIDDTLELRIALLNFIADFSRWENSTQPEYLRTSRSLTHAALCDSSDGQATAPTVLDPFAGGGSIHWKLLGLAARLWPLTSTP